MTFTHHIKILGGNISVCKFGAGGGQNVVHRCWGGHTSSASDFRNSTDPPAINNDHSIILPPLTFQPETVLRNMTLLNFSMSHKRIKHPQFKGQRSPFQAYHDFCTDRPQILSRRSFENLVQLNFGCSPLWNSATISSKILSLKNWRPLPFKWSSN